MVTIGDLENNEIESIHIEGITNIPLIKGEQGEKGDKGDKGETNNIKIGTVETGEKASATLEGESPNQILNLVLPKGDKGEQGEPGIKPVKGIDYFTEEEIQEIKSNILDQVNQFSVLVVEELPTDNIDEHTIYFVPKTKTEQNDVYDEFIYINNGWEHIGTTEVDLSSYYKKDEIDTKLEAVEGNEVFVGNEEEAPSSAKIIVEEDDFVEGSTLGKAEIFVGAEEPTAGEKVWFRKGKNLFNKNVSIITGYYLDNKGSLVSKEGSWYQNVFIEVNSKTQYTISSTVAVLRICFYDKDRKFISRVATENTSVTFSTPENCKYVRLSGENADTQVQSLQLEQGSKATSYEDYIEPKIYVRNSNGVYEEFTKKSEEVYSTEEQRIGIWNGKKLYRKTIEVDTSSSFTNSTLTKYEHKIANIEKIIKATSTAKTSWGGGWFTDITLAINKFQIRADETYLYIKNDSGSDYKLEYLAVILEYTKTTD